MYGDLQPSVFCPVGCGLLQCQAEIPGAPAAADCGAALEIQPSQEGAGTSQAVPHAGPRKMESRV